MSQPPAPAGVDEAAPAGFDPAAPYRLHPQAELRDEAFGALAYHFGTRTLSFLKAPALVDVVKALADSPSVHAAVEACKVPGAQRPAILRALSGLEASEMIQRRPAPEGATQ
ncbi:MAG: mycofactocin biosynthesis chaperone MftB [Geodermatophilaceae bacterium]|nr:mycofactocin biosynthesis chaperone MftB [Geodermatophilaceae bacterium]